MQTPTRIRLENPSLPHQQKADDLRKAMPNHPERVLECLVSGADDAWKVIQTRLQKKDVYAIRVALDDLYHCVRTACTEIFYTEVMLRIPRNAEEEARRAKDKPLLHQVRRLLNLSARIVHELQKDIPEVHAHTLLTPMAAEYAELIASVTRNSLGPLNDDRYHHPARYKWAAIHARTKRRLANLWLKLAQEDEELMAKFGAQAEMR